MNGSCARMLSTVSIMLAPGWRNTMSVTARLLFNTRARMFCTESVTWATSERRMAAPLLYQRLAVVIVCV